MLYRTWHGDCNSFLNRGSNVRSDQAVSSMSLDIGVL